MTITTINRTLGVFFIFLAVFLFGYEGQAQTLGSLYAQGGNEELYIEEGASLKGALEKLEQHYNVGLLYRSTIVEGVAIRQSSNLSLNVEEALSFLLKGTDLRFKALNPKTYGVYRNPVVFPQAMDVPIQQSVRGTVTDAETGEVLPGVNVIVAGSEEATGSTIGTTTDMDGQYEIQVSEGLNTLAFSFIGYLRTEINIDGRSEINVELESDVQMLEDIVVVGYGTQQRQDITGAIRQISGRELQKQPAVQTSAALMGTLPGVQVQQSSGQPGANQGTIRIRGIGTLGNANPLVLIDGVEGELDDVASSDVESLTVLKDASAAAVYGSRAANGVILVTTKRGLEDGIELNYRAFAGIQSATDQPTFVDAGTFMRLENEGATNLDKSPIWSESFINEWENNYQTDPDRYPNTDWVNEFFSEMAYQQSHHLDILGGTERIRYMGSLSFDEEVGEIPNFDFQRYNLRLNTDVKATDKINLSFDLNVQRNDQKQPGINLGGDQFAVYRVPPIYAAQYSHGGWGPGWNNDNPVAFVNDGGLERRQTNKIRGRLNVDFQPIDNLQLNLMYAPDYETFFVRSMTKQFSVSSPESPEEIVARHPAQNSLSQNLNNQFSNNFNFTGEYQVNFKNHNFRTLAGFEYVDFRNDFFTAFRDNFPLQDYEQLNAGSADNMQNSGSAAEWAIASFFGRINYDFKNKYLFEANVRYDGSSRFVPENRWGMFPSFSVGWMISEERFMDNIGFINSFKIRASWGRLGNQQIGNYPFASVINLSQPYIFGGSTATGGAQLDLSNDNITWETTTSSNIGVDLAFLEDQIFFHFDYFHRETEDILLQLPVPQIIGLNAPFQNAGVVENVGWELEAGYSGFVGNDFSYRIGFNLSDVKNEVIDLRGAGPFISGNTIIKEGHPINSIWGFESDGLFQSQAEIDAHATQTGDIAPGDIRYVDQNDDGAINADDRVVLGDNFPNLNFGINLSANYKSIDVSAFIQGVGNRDVLLQGNAVWPLWNAGKVRDWQAEDYWAPDNPDAFTPRLTQATTHSNFQSSDYWVFDASYLRLRNIQVGYSLPESLTNQIGLRDARIFFLGQNLFTLTRSFPESNGMPPGVDPNVPNGTSGQFYPVTRLISAGVDINF